MGLDLDGIKKRQSEGRKGKFWRPGPGRSHIRIFKFTHLVTEADVKAGYFTKDKLGKTIEDFDRPVTLIFGQREDKKPVLATKELLEQYERLSTSKSKSDKAMAEKCKPQRKGLLNIVDTDVRPFRMQLWQAPSGVVGDLFAKVCDEDYGEDILGPEGRDYTIKFDKDAAPAKMYSIDVRDREKSPKLPEELAEKAIDFYGDKLDVVLGLVDKDEEEDEETTEEGEEEADEEPAATKPKSKPKAEEPEEEQEEEAEERPAKSTAKPVGKKKPADEDEDDDD